MKRIITIVVLSMMVGLGGCLPEKRVAWSPDGRWAAVKGADGLYLSDAQGRLSPRLVERVTQAVWLPDSQHLVISRSDPVTNWRELARVLGAERAALLEKLAPRLKEEMTAYAGDWKEFKPDACKGLTGGEALALLVYVREHLGQGLPEKLGTHWADYEKLSAAVHTLQVAAVGDGGSMQLGRKLAQAVDAFTDLRMAPTGRAVAFRGAARGEDDSRPLLAVPTDGDATPALVAAHAAMFPDWSADGRYLVYAATTASFLNGEKDLRLGTVARRQVCGENGALLASFEQPEELAGVVYQDELRVRCLRDGRVLFAALPVQLPCTAKDMPERAGLFAVDPGRHPGVVSLVPRQTEVTLPDVMFLFEVSPDERHVCVPGSDGRVAVLTLATGDAWEVVHEGAADHLRIEPTWRSADELCFAVVPGPEAAKERPAIALAQLDWQKHEAKPRLISADWPETVTSDFLERKQAASPDSVPSAGD